MHIGPMEIFLILVVALLLFGGKRIPELAKALASASFEFKKAKQELQKEALEIKKEVQDDSQQVQQVEEKQ